MFLGTISQNPTVANTNIPIITQIVTNNKVINNTVSNAIELKKAGIYNIDGWLEMTGVTGDIDVNFLADGVVRRTITVTIGAVTDNVVVPIVDAVRAILASYPNVADISLQVNTAGLEVTGLVRVEYLQ